MSCITSYGGSTPWYSQMSLVHGRLIMEPRELIDKMSFGPDALKVIYQLLTMRGAR